MSEIIYVCDRCGARDDGCDEFNCKESRFSDQILVPEAEGTAYAERKRAELAEDECLNLRHIRRIQNFELSNWRDRAVRLEKNVGILRKLLSEWQGIFSDFQNVKILSIIYFEWAEDFNERVEIALKKTLE